VRVVVVGGGVAGLSFARYFGDALVLEEHSRVGMPAHCAGLISLSGMIRARIKPSLIISSYDRISLTNLRRTLTFVLPRKEVVLVDRVGLEEWLAEGAIVELRSKVVRVGRNRVVLKGGREVKFDKLIVAEGACAKIAKELLGLSPRKLVGLQVDARGSLDLDHVLVVLNSKLSRTYFSWVIPVDRRTFRVGVADELHVPEKLRKLLNVLKLSPCSKPFGGAILRGPVMPRVVHGDIAFVGDAVGMVKPTSGGGVIMSMISAEVLARSLRRGGFDEYKSYVFRKLLPYTYASRIASYVLYERGLGEVLIDELGNGEVKAFDYDDHLKDLALALLQRPKAVRYLLPTYYYTLHFLKKFSPSSAGEPLGDWL